MSANNIQPYLQSQNFIIPVRNQGDITHFFQKKIANDLTAYLLVKFTSFRRRHEPSHTSRNKTPSSDPRRDATRRDSHDSCDLLIVAYFGSHN